MTTQDMITLLAALTSYDQDNFSADSSGAVTDAQAVAQLNVGLREVSEYIREYDPKITLTLTAGTANYNIRDTTSPVVSKKVFEVHRVYINGVPLANARGRTDDPNGLWTEQEMMEWNNQWVTTTSSGTPTRACQIADRLWLHVTPDAACVAAANNYVSGIYLAANLSSSALSTIPDLPEEVHEAVCYLAAVHAAGPSATDPAAINRLQGYRNTALAAMEKVRKRNTRMQLGTPSLRGPRTSYIRT